MVNKYFQIFFTLIFFIPLLGLSESYIKASNGIIWDKNNQTYSAKGNVEFKNSEIKAFANEILATYKIENGKEIFQKVDLNQNVKIFYQEEIFTSDEGTYSRDKGIINLIGNVKIVSPDRFLSGDELEVDLKKNTRILKTNGKESVAEALIKDE